ncbi:BatA domain-containing protein [Brevundimonas lutea]|uniref:BatA domain-containing protein n=1 Tax=Brevundimonas lutea TaxID=2293980 RepID=UPI000F02A60E|nr:BatA domain-containing protein [Brevundimonas lutea]
MTPTLLAPLGLVGLAALAIPLIIHIARRNESRTVQFAAMRWLEARPRPRRRVRFDELWLLAIRLALLILVALWLAQPALFGVTDDRPVVAVTPGLSPGAAPDIEGARRVWLAPDFPDLASPAPPAPVNPISLLRELDARLPPEASLTVIAPSILDGVDAERPVLARSVDWRVVEAPSPAEVDPPEPPQLVVRHDEAHAGGARYFRAVAAAWTEAGEPAFETAALDARLPNTDSVLVWLASGPMPDRVVGWIEGGGAAIISDEIAIGGRGEGVWRDDDGAQIAERYRLGSGSALRLTRALEPQSFPQLLEPEFPDRLRALIAPPPEPARVRAVDHAPLSGAAPYPLPPLEMRSWLAVLIALLFALERWMATRSRRAIAA